MRLPFTLALAISLFTLPGCGYLYEASLTAPDTEGYKEVITSRAHTFRYRSDVPSQDAPQIVYVHGKLGSSNDFVKSPLFDELKEDFTLFAYDRPGSGHSLGREGWWAWTPDDFADHLHELLELEGISNPLFVAHSWGGAIAINYAIRYPENTRGMVLLAPAAYPWPGYFSTGVYDWFISSYLLSDIFLQTIFVPLGKLLGPFSAKPVFAPQEVPEEFFEHVLPLAIQPTAYQRAARDTVELCDQLGKQAPRYHEITAPTIVLSDDDDKAVPARIHGGPLVETIQNGEIRYFTDVGHTFTHAKAPFIAQAVRDVVSRSTY